MTVDEFITWSLAQPHGRFELFNGEVIAMNAERARHWRGKAAVFDALRSALKISGLAGEVALDGPTVRINQFTAFEPDALVYIGPLVDGNAIEITNPIIVVEVVSPSSSAIDSGTKLRGYFSVPSVMHYLIVDPLEHSVTHHARTSEGTTASTTMYSGELHLDPPGLMLSISGLLPALD